MSDIAWAILAVVASSFVADFIRGIWRERRERKLRRELFVLGARLGYSIKTARVGLKEPRDRPSTCMTNVKGIGWVNLVVDDVNGMRLAEDVSDKHDTTSN